eukprot:TRINITY_DN117_c1_g1_i1.p1 TRINITY_DN117_c1_g1~~TRINITY_DN117_c1_g1_i1.p1  ORF type:complete len:131 (-),score=41.24 TRINITY_DN117_c1_g1_i1:284-676(-)
MMMKVIIIMINKKNLKEYLKKQKISMSEEQPDMSNWTENEKAIYKKYGKLPKKNDFMKRMLQGKDRARFDSADFEMQKKRGIGPGMRGMRPGLGGKGKPPIPANLRAEMEAATNDDESNNNNDQQEESQD